jgi:solute carrier family 35 protein F5
LIINAILGTVISDYCWAKSVVLLGPLITTLGITLTIPISMVVDSFYEDKVFTWMHYSGAALILASFITISYRDYQEEKSK